VTKYDKAAKPKENISNPKAMVKNSTSIRVKPHNLTKIIYAERLGKSRTEWINDANRINTKNPIEVLADDK